MTVVTYLFIIQEIKWKQKIKQKKEKSNQEK